LTILIGVLAGGAVWLSTGSGALALEVLTRLSLFGVGGGVACAVGRSICGAATQRLMSMRLAQGDVGGIVGWIAGMLLAGFVAEKQESAREAAESPLALGQAVEIAGPTVDGGRFDLANHRGKVVLVDFWATWCTPCVAELPNVRAVYDKYHADGLEVVSVSFDFERSALVKFLEARPIPWPQIFFEAKEQSGFENPLGRRYGITAIPCLLVIDREGKLAARDVRGGQLDTAVAEALGQPVPWGHRFAGGGLRVAGWFFQGIMAAQVWLVLACVFGAAFTAALAEAAFRRLRGRPAPGGVASA
jgi:thiol-disulfide isomerase/thioredoxin